MACMQARAFNEQVLLVVLDGFGEAPPGPYNAISMARTPHWSLLKQQGLYTTLLASGDAVGLPRGQIGNSEVGHLTLGAGRVLWQDLSRIDHHIEQGSFFKAPALEQLLQLLRRPVPPRVHLMGLLSSGGVHSHERHWWALLSHFAAMKLPPRTIFCHPFLDGRDVPPQSARVSLERLEALATSESGIAVASLMGRYYGMDRDARWDRTERAFEVLVDSGKPATTWTALEALEAAYSVSETDEFVKPVRLRDHEPVREGDMVVFLNFRADRMRQLSTLFRRKWPQGSLMTLTEYDAALKAQIIFPPLEPSETLSVVLSKAGCSQLRVAETEKYAHVTYFFNGGIEEKVPLESRHVIPSPAVPFYQETPQMSAFELTSYLERALASTPAFDFILCNFANADLLGHTGVLSATIAAIEVLDECLGRLMEACARSHCHLLVTADHGNAECLVDTLNRQPHTAHTTAPVPFVYWHGSLLGQRRLSAHALGEGAYPPGLVDVAPTVLHLLQIPPSPVMSGRSLLIG